MQNETLSMLLGKAQDTFWIRSMDGLSPATMYFSINTKRGPWAFARVERYTDGGVYVLIKTHAAAGFKKADADQRNLVMVELALRGLL